MSNQTKEQKEQLAKYASAIVDLASFLNLTQTDHQLRLYSLFVARNITLPEFISARQVYLDTSLIDRPANEEMYKTLAKIIEIAKPKANREEEALNIATKIMGAVTKYGYTLPADARVFIGEVGWEVVQMRGGWPQHCQSVTANNMTSLTAQIRDMVDAKLRAGGRSQFFGQLESKASAGQMLGSQDATKLLEMAAIKQIG